MNIIKQVGFLLKITRSHGILRRYFIVNGFDGALTMLGMITGFIFSAEAHIAVVINACIGAAIALGVSGVSSAYVSEAAERRRALSQLEEAMVTNLQQSAHGMAAKWVPYLIALVNGLSPLLISLLILSPLWLAQLGFPLPVMPLYASVATAFVLVFLLGVVLGRIEGISWFRSGLQTLLIAFITALLIYVFTA